MNIRKISTEKKNLKNHFFQAHVTKLELTDYTSLTTFFQFGPDPKRLTEFSFANSELTDPKSHKKKKCLAFFNQLLTYLAKAENLRELTWHLDTLSLPNDR